MIKTIPTIDCKGGKESSGDRNGTGGKESRDGGNSKVVKTLMILYRQ